MPQLLGRTPAGGYRIQGDDGQIVESAILPPGMTDPSVGMLGQFGPQPAAAPPGFGGAGSPDMPDVPTATGGWKRSQPSFMVPGLSAPSAAPPPVPTDPFSQQMAAKLRGDFGTVQQMTPEEMAAAGKAGGAGPAAPGLVTYRPGMSGGGAPGGMPAMGGGGGQRVIPGRMQTASISTQNKTLLPEGQDAIDAAMGNQTAATGDVYDAQSANATSQAAAKRQIAGTVADSDQWDAAAERGRQGQLAKATEDLQQVQHAYETGDYADKGYEEFGGRVLAGIAGAFAGIADATLGTSANSDRLMKQINGYIERSREQAKSKVEGKQNLINILDKQFGSQRAADAAARVMLLDNASRQYDALVTENSAPELQAKKKLAQAEIGTKQAEWMSQFQTAVTEKHDVMTRPTVVGGAPKPQEVENKLLVKDMNGNTFVSDDPETATKLRATHALASQAIDAAADMKRIANSGIGEKLDPTSPLGKQWAFAQERYINSMNTLQGQGVVRGEDIERYKSDVTGGKFGLAAAAMAQTLADKVRFGYDAQVKAAVDTEAPATREWYTDPKTGQVKRHAIYDVGRAASPERPVNFQPAGGAR